jgi:hypothetical protein
MLLTMLDKYVLTSLSPVRRIHDGYFLAEELPKREERINSRVPLVAFTAYGRVEDKVKS